MQGAGTGRGESQDFVPAVKGDGSSLGRPIASRIPPGTAPEP